MVALKVGDVDRVELSQSGLSMLAGLHGYNEPVSAELLDGSGRLCGRARRMADPAAGRFGPGMSWHVQIGGITTDEPWRTRPLACGSGASPLEAARAAMEHLRREAAEREAQAGRIGAMLGVR